MVPAIRAIIVAAVCTVGCVSLSMRVDSPSYPSGGNGYAKLKNGGWWTAQGNFCTSYGLQRRCGKAWLPIDRPNRRCTKELERYASGSIRDVPFRIPLETPSGTYRLVTRFEVGGSDHEVTSNEFSVVGSRADGCQSP